MDLDIYGKRLEILKQAAPSIKKAAMLVSPGKPFYQRGSPWTHNMETAAHSLGVELEIVEAHVDSIDSAFAALAASGAGGVVVTADGAYEANSRAVAEAAIKHRLASMFTIRQQVQAGGLLAYAARYADLSRRAAFFVDRILKGAKPSDLPIEQPTRFELVINLRTAKRLGLDLPPMLLAQADEVIE
jgi:putative ABC transport system substrate-binding protein